uniref:Protein archease n=1 Tax=Ciona intestinalis TaxID=7719 RepID=F7AW07_CIOIN|nr:protein archease-like [Ciona intestinalis]|eukprot:XP_009859270.1 protein archease-like [Ciona intestinalis]
MEEKLPAYEENTSGYHNVIKKFEYLDHTADVQIHSWGDNIEETFEQAAMAMFNYMTDIDGVRPVKTVEITAEGTDYMSLLFHFMDEFLFLSSCDDFFMAREIKITNFDRENWRMEALGYGEDFNQERHGGKGTEVKAITYSAMQVIESEAKSEIFVIVDI